MRGERQSECGPNEAKVSLCTPWPARWEEKERLCRSLGMPRLLHHAHMSSIIHDAAFLATAWPFVAHGMPVCVATRIMSR